MSSDQVGESEVEYVSSSKIFSPENLSVQEEDESDDDFVKKKKLNPTTPLPRANSTGSLSFYLHLMEIIIRMRHLILTYLLKRMLLPRQLPHLPKPAGHILPILTRPRRKILLCSRCIRPDLPIH